MKLAVVLSVVAVAACSDDKAGPGQPLAQADDLVIVAHQGDELRYMADDIVNEIGTTPVTTVVVTQGSSESVDDPADAADATGIKAAYAFLAGASVNDWACGAITVNQHTVRHCVLAAAKASLVFLDLPFGNHDGSAAQSLLHLWEANPPTIATVTDAKDTYAQADLIATLAAIVTASAPKTLRTLEIAATHGDDHSDHMLVGAAAWLALAATQVSTAPQIFAYRGDNIANEAANVTPSDRGELAFAKYLGPCVGACPVDPTLQLRQRRYPILARASTSGAFQIGSQCASFTGNVGDNGTLVACAGAPSFTYAATDLAVRHTGGCVRSLFTAELVEDTACAAGDPGVHFLYDQDGHLWFGVPPAPAADMSFAHLVCMDAAGGRPRGALCGASHDVTVTLGAPTP